MKQVCDCVSLFFNVFSCRDSPTVFFTYSHELLSGRAWRNLFQQKETGRQAASLGMRERMHGLSRNCVSLSFRRCCWACLLVQGHRSVLEGGGLFAFFVFLVATDANSQTAFCSHCHPQTSLKFLSTIYLQGQFRAVKLTQVRYNYCSDMKCNYIYSSRIKTKTSKSQN